MFYDQQEFDVRCEWGAHGVAALAPISDVLIIVDVMSFCTSVDIAVARGATIFPYREKDESAAEFAAAHNAELADSKRVTSRYSLAPESLLQIRPGERLVLPSRNGSTLALGVGPTPVLAGCLRNARAVARAAMTYGPRIAVIPAGERWKDDMSLRPAFEDLMGAGAIISHLRGRLSAEARAALAAFREAQPDLVQRLRECGSGKELIGRGFSTDLELASQLDVSEAAPTLIEDAFGPSSTPVD